MLQACCPDTVRPRLPSRVVRSRQVVLISDPLLELADWLGHNEALVCCQGKSSLY